MNLSIVENINQIPKVFVSQFKILNHGCGGHMMHLLDYMEHSMLKKYYVAYIEQDGIILSWGILHLMDRVWYANFFTASNVRRRGYATKIYKLFKEKRYRFVVGNSYEEEFFKKMGRRINKYHSYKGL